MSQRYIGDLVFDADCLFAKTQRGERIKFSRHERALLRHFIAHPGVLLSRDQLLDCIEHVDGSNRDRNVDPAHNEWKNHGAYVRCVANTAETFFAEDLISEAEKDDVVSAAGNSDVGKK